ncbi:carbohydrate kinase family protein [Ileibacterium valens]|uniref:carbohydrate kinase family protein n=1 Tax=Ileibacterium valens TaxID=1862668 RepID=UPI00272C9322|nr:carbohydrate kinase [Ileibacterium valens]
MSYEVTAFGEILIDFTHTNPEDDGPALFAQNPGGAPGNVCVAVNRLGGNSAFLGVVGEDMHGDLLRKTLENENVSTKGLLSHPQHFTTLAFVSVDKNGERSFSFARKPGADTQMRAEDLDLDEIKNGKIFHIGSLSLTHEPARSATLFGIEKAKEFGNKISYDPNYRASLWSSEEEAINAMRSLIPYADIMKISDEETKLLTGFKDPEEAARALIDQGVKIAAVTLGSEGALVANKEGISKVKGFKADVADTNGAGDSFWGTMLYQIAISDKNIDDLTLDELSAMLRIANAAASLTCRKHGAIPALPTMEDVTEFLKTQE